MFSASRSPRHSIIPSEQSNRSPRGSIVPENIRTSPRGSIAGEFVSERSPRGSIGPESADRSPRGSLARSDGERRSPRGSLTLTFQEPPASERRASADSAFGKYIVFIEIHNNSRQTLNLIFLP